MSEPLLYTELITRSFGGLLAVNKLSLTFRRGQVHAIIGPNGAGKTTFINLLSGDLLPTSGQITFNGQNITQLPAYKTSLLGIGRSYQRTNIFHDFSCWQNVWLAAQSRIKSSMRFFRSAESYAEISKVVEWALEISKLENSAAVRASNLSYGEKRQLEIGMLLAMKPKVLLLDEPMAGMSKTEVDVVIDLVKRLTSEHCIVLIEHDMDAVFAVADILSVMDNGRLLATGAPNIVRGNPKVIEAYLGNESFNE